MFVGRADWSLRRRGHVSLTALAMVKVILPTDAKDQLLLSGTISP